ncbi:MAG: glycosyltransferase [Planctomycetota bacterium]
MRVPASPAAELGEFRSSGVSVIIPAHRDSAKLRRAMWSVATTADLPFELIVALAPQSVAKNRNAGLDRASQDVVAFLDDDVLLPAHWLSRLVEALAGARDLGAVSARLTFADGRPQMRDAALGGADGPAATTIPGTCFVYSRRRVNDQRFDHRYRGSQWEDTDWVWHVHQRGLRTVVCRDVHVVHEHQVGPKPHLEDNMRYFLGKWGRLPTVTECATIDRDELRAWSRPPIPGAVEQ